jgi:cellulose synthase/poly-beta-1,6-N-acetylglucosamine synthase-like glycosyltransferase
LPPVTVQLPIYNEYFVSERIINTVCEMDYPKDKLEIQVLDDSTDETRDVVDRVVAKKQGEGFDIKVIRRENRTGFKAGALANGLKTAKGEFVAIFDADFVPPADFLHRTIHYFTDEKVGIVQTKWGYLNKNLSLLTNLQSIWLDGHFYIEHNGRARSGKFINFNGTGGIIRKKTIYDAGGWHYDTLTEDLDLSFRAQLKGWKIIYADEVVTPSELPVDMNGLKSQQHRWTKGAIQTGKKLCFRILKSVIPFHVKFEACFYLIENFAYVFALMLMLLILPVTLIRVQGGFDSLYIVDMGVFFFATMSLCTYGYCAQYLADKNSSVLKKLINIPMLISLGIGLSINNTRAVIEGLFGKTGVFVRTPKYDLSNSKVSVVKKYLLKSGLTVIIECLLGFYFIAQTVVCIVYQLYAAIPFMLLFVFGFFYVALTSIIPQFKLAKA